MELFRKEAVEASVLDNAQIFIQTPKAHHAAGLAALAVCIGAGLFIIFANYSRREHVVGHLVPSNGEIRVLSRRSSSVSKIYVHELQHVKKGDALIRLSDEITTNDGGVHASTQRHINLQITEIESSIAATEENLNSEKIQLKTKISSIDAQLNNMRDQITYQLTAVSQKNKTLNKLKPLLKDGYVPEYQVQEIESGLLDSQTQVSALKRQLAEMEQEQREARQRLTSINAESLLKTNELQRERERLEATLTQDQSDLEIIVRAEENSMVSTLLVQQAAAINPGQAILTLVPEPSTIVAEVFIPSSAIGFIHPGTRVALHYAAFPYQKYGVQYASIESISQTPVLPSQVSELLGQAPPPQPLYRAKAKLEHQKIYVEGASKHLNPGMQLDAELLLERRSIASWLFEPVSAFHASVQN
ncbi:HlyD family secretion protein [Xanthomonas fragariae]|uniref:HlyD family secretion protein n=1 Tax=Xanthomonas fragariae TaxID=48664 RepID=UPI0022AA9BF5|nr:HlyD family efflux transporter periplasmic adaptor subunit [Xanthomonas fragariae]WAT15011.1 HlyD family efflux transporter periplasmic adaptor subunit [Xanthomonas fragariae]